MSNVSKGLGLLALLVTAVILAPVAGLAQSGGDDDGYGYGYGSSEGWTIEIGRGTVLESGNFEFDHAVPSGLDDRYDIYAVGTARDSLPYEDVVVRVTPADEGSELPLLITNLEPESTVILEARAESEVNALLASGTPAESSDDADEGNGSPASTSAGTSTSTAPDGEEALAPTADSAGSNTTRGLIGLGVAGLILIGAAGYAISLTNRARA